MKILYNKKEFILSIYAYLSNILASLNKKKKSNTSSIMY